MTPQQRITLVASVIIIVMATAGLVFNLFASTIKIPTYVNDTANLIGTNIQGNSFKFVVALSMDFCILFNSENRH